MDTKQVTASLFIIVCWEFCICEIAEEGKHNLLPAIVSRLQKKKIMIS